MDFNDFILEFNEKYGTSDDDWNRIRRSGIITFEYDDRGYVSGKHKGITVYRDKKYENTILPGETWICTLELNPQSHANYFATPLQRIDASFIFELLKDQTEEMANVIWGKHKDAIEPMMEEKYRDKVKEDIASAIKDTRDEYESIVEEMKQKIQELEMRDKENEKIIGSLQNKVSNTDIDRKNMEYTTIGMNTDISIRRTGPDSIASEYFNTSRYFVHLSADYRTMIVVPHEKGDVVCIDETITLNGLNSVSPFSAPYDMVTEYNPKYGGAQIYLK